MNSWLQEADFTSKDIAPLSSLADFESFFGALDLPALDEKLMALQTNKRKWCQWGIGVGMDSNYGLHVCRDGFTPPTFQVFITDVQASRIFGFFPIRKDLGYSRKNLSAQEMWEEVKKFYETKAL
jgi:hypothetical protein